MEDCNSGIQEGKGKAVMLAMQTLRQVPFFAGIPDAAIADLSSKARWMRARKHQVIISHTDPSTDVFIPVTGSLRIQIYAPNGRLITLRDAYEGELIGELSALDNAPRSASVVAKTDCLIAVLTGDLVMTTLREHPVLMERLARQLVCRVRELTGQVFEMAMLEVKDRILAELWRIALKGKRTDAGILIKPAPTHEMIAHQVGTHREAVTRTLSWLQSEGIVEKRRGLILVVKEDQLVSMVDRLQGFSAPRFGEPGTAIG